MSNFPPPDATYSEIQAWHAANAKPAEIPHEAPPVENGPSIVCSACGVVRIGLRGPPFCKGCIALIGEVT